MKAPNQIQEFERRWLLNLPTNFDWDRVSSDISLANRVINKLQKYLILATQQSQDTKIATVYITEFDRIKCSYSDTNPQLKFTRTTKLPKDRYESTEISIESRRSEFDQYNEVSRHRKLKYRRFKYLLNDNHWKVKEICVDVLDEGFVILEMEFIDKTSCKRYKLPKWFNLIASELIGGNSKFIFAR